MATATTAAISFAPVCHNDIGRFAPLLAQARSRSCDFTIGGIFMWLHYFGYEGAIVGGTLFIHGLSEDDSRRPAFSLPVGEMPLRDAVDIIKDYCRATNQPLLFSAIPEDRLADVLQAVGTAKVTELPDWADYLYDAHLLATLPGKAFNKKRNHVHRFMADNPGWRLDDITGENAGEVLAFFEQLESTNEKADPIMAEYEREQCLEVLRNWNDYGFEGAMLRDNGGRIVAFTAGEVAGDTLVLHIEKMDHSVSGAGETINHTFAARMLSRHPEISFINREDDGGDPGLRAAKLSYHPACRLRKFNVEVAL